VTHVVRGQEYISSIPKFLSLYEALGQKPPTFLCLPHIMGKDGNKKLGKRDGAKDALEYKNEGYLPDAMINFLALLGWHPSGDREIFSREELIKVFEVERIQKSGAQWDDQKLDWINKEHLKLLPPEELEKNIFEWLPEEMRKPKLVPLIAERISKFGDIKEMIKAGELDLFFTAPEYQKEKLIFKNTSPEQTSKNLKMAKDALEILDDLDFTKEEVKEVLMKIADKLGSRGELLHPVRFALSGLDKSPDPFTIAEILGKNETLSRLEKAI